MRNLAIGLRGYIQKNWKKIVLGTAAVAMFVVIWHSYAWYLDSQDSIKAEYFPYPGEVAGSFFESFVAEDPVMGLLMFDHIFSSLKRVVMGFCIAVIIALPVGLLMGGVAAAEAAGNPILEIFRPIPPIAWIPMFMLLFGVIWGPVGIVFLGIFFPVLLNVIFGVKSVDPVQVDAAKTLGATKVHVFTKVIFPATMPYLMTGIKVGLGIGWMCIVAAEMLGAVGGGVGYYIFAMASVGRFDLTYVGMAVVGLLGVLTTGVAGIFEERLYRWMGMK